MAPLRELQGLVHRALRRELPVEAAAAELGMDPRRLALYRDFVHGHVRSALDKDYPLLRDLLPAARWEALVDGFFGACPPAHWEVNRLAEPFPAFLAERLAAGEPGLAPFHVSLARFEWEQFATYVHPARIPPAAERAARTVNPTASLLELAVPVVRTVVAWRDGRLDREAPLPGPADGPERVLLLRHPETARTSFWIAVDDLLFALKVAWDGLDPEEAARAAGLDVAAARAAMARAVEIGLVLEPGA